MRKKHEKISELRGEMRERGNKKERDRKRKNRECVLHYIQKIRELCTRDFTLSLSLSSKINNERIKYNSPTQHGDQRRIG